ncbi:MAG: hypothetical protein WDM89_01500 [Rhizomicrobium sp.]
MPGAVGQNSQPNPADFPDQPAPPRTDDELRRYAAEQLVEHLAIGVSMATRCHGLSAQAHNDKVGPLNAAARLMQANARVAEALATFAQIERRSRTISERIQPPDPKKLELNSKLEKEKASAETLTKFWQRMDEHVENSVRARMGEGNDDRIALLLKKQKQKLAYAERRLAGEEDPSYVFHDDEDDEGEDWARRAARQCQCAEARQIYARTSGALCRDPRAYPRRQAAGRGN